MTVSNMQYTEYTPAHAKGIADMWNCSGEGWNGEVYNETEATVLNKEANSTHLHLFLALDGEKVVGYCKLTRYPDEANTLLIEPLNVDPAYHGQKIGRRLVQLCVEKTVELGYPRLDLFTWEGNLKAVPLYKKCGFFWEKMERATHFFNFMPAVLQNELLKPYFKELDWYQDSVREIKVEPDGIKENGFERYFYEWQKGDLAVKAGFERSGRSLCYLETPDYLIETIINEEKPVYGQEYQAQYKITNKSGKLLKVEIQAVDDENIKAAFTLSAIVTNHTVLTGQFKIETKTEDFSEWKTASGLTTLITINGLTASFKTGLKAYYPVTADFNQKRNYYFKGQESTLYLTLENKSSGSLSVEAEVNSNTVMQFEKTVLKADLQKAEKRAFELPYTVINGGLSKPDIDITVIYADGSRFSYNDTNYMLVCTAESVFQGETKNNCFMANGPWYLSVDKSHEFHSGNFINVVTEGTCWHNAPICGNNCSSELKNQRPIKYEFTRDDSSQSLRVFCRSAESGLEFWYVWRIFSNGLLEFRFEEIVNSSGETQKLALPFGFDQQKTFYRTAGQTVCCSGHEKECFDWESVPYDELEENWLYNQMPDHSSLALIWPPDSRLNSADWQICCEFSIAPGTTAQTGTLRFMRNHFQNWQTLREIMFNINDLPGESAVGILELEINNGDPLCSAVETEVKVRRFNKAPLEGRMEFSVAGETIENVQIPEKSNQLELSLPVRLPEGCPVKIGALMDYKSSFRMLSKAVFPAFGKNSGVDITEEGSCLTASNSLLSISADNQFGPVFHSLKHQNREWLYSTYPDPQPLQWWNPFLGGIKCYGSHSNSQLLKEKRSLSPATATDNWKRVWQGLKIELEFIDLESLKGLKATQYAMLLPDRPLLALFTVLENQTGSYQRYCSSDFGIFARPEENLQNCSIEYEASDGSIRVINSGHDDISNWGAQIGKTFAFASKENPLKMQIFFSDNSNRTYTGSFVNPQLLNAGSGSRLPIPHGQSRTMPPVFIFFSEETFRTEVLRDLRNIKFNI